MQERHRDLHTFFRTAWVLAAAAALASTAATALAGPDERVGRSPAGPGDQIGRLAMMTPASRQAVLSRIDGRRVYDLGVEYFIGMPSWQAAGDPPYQMWMTHTPEGTVADDPMNVGKKQNRKVSYTGDAVSLYTHTGTHIDALNHFGLDGHIWNGFSVKEHLGDRGWHKAGAETIPPIVGRGVLIDVASARGVDVLPPSHGIGARDLQQALDRQGVRLERGDIVLIRTGRMRNFKDGQKYMSSPPGLNLDGARFLVDKHGAMLVGADNLSFETFPVETPDNWVPVHTYLLAERGVPIMEVVDLEALARDRVYEFAFIGSSLKLKGASGAPMRPLAFPLVRR